MSEDFDDTMKLFRVSELSDESGNRDTLLDQMQEKMEELLRINQELAAAKERIRELETEVKQKRSGDDIGDRQEVAMIELRGKNRDLETENEHLRHEIAELKNQIAEMVSGSEEDLREQARAHSEELKKAVEAREGRISALEAHVKELETMNSINNNSFLEQQSHVLDLTEKTHKMEVSVRDLERDKRVLSDKIGALNSEVEKLKQKIKSLSEDCSRIEKEKLQAEQVLEQVHLSNERNMTALNALDEQYMTILAACDAKSLEECLRFVEKSKKMLKQYNEKYPKLRKAYKGKKAEARAAQCDAKEKEEQIRELTEAKADLEHQLKASNDSNQSMQARLDRAERRDRIGTAFANVNHHIQMGLSQLQTVLHPTDTAEPSMRSFIYMTIMMHRWLSMRGQPKKYSRDARNWWWLDAKSTDCSDILDSVRQLLNTKAHLESQNAELQKTLDETVAAKDTEIQTLSNNISQLTEQNSTQSSQIEELQAQVGHQAAIMQRMTDPTDYTVLAKKYAHIKTAVKTLIDRLIQSEDKIAELTNVAHEASRTRDETAALKQKIESELHLVQDEYEQKTEELELIYKELMERTKDMVCLEHTLQSESTARTIMQLQVASLVKENEILQNKPFCRPASPVRSANLSCQLNEMAQNLRGTLC